MIDIRTLDQFDPGRFQVIASGYRTQEVYRVTHVETAERITFDLYLESLPDTQEFRFPYSQEELKHYHAVIPSDYCLGAWNNNLLVGVALSEPREWNRTLWVWEFHVDEPYQGRGIGRRLMAELADRALQQGLRAIVCETQNTNIPAILFYRAVGFRMEGVDISYYTNEDMLPGRTVAVFMKLRFE